MNENEENGGGVDLEDKEPASLFEHLYSEYYDRVFKTAYSVTKNRQDALDVVQETFLKVLMNIEDVEPSKNVAAWLSKIAHNRSINHVTSKAEQSVVSMQEYLSRELSSDKWPRFELSPQERHMLKALAESIMESTKELSDQQQKIFSLYYVKQLDTNEIAQKLDISASTVRVHLHRASKGLRKMLGSDILNEEEEEDEDGENSED